MAALIPGLLAALFYCIVIAWSSCAAARSWRPPARSTAARARQGACCSVWPVLLVALIVVGGIYGGVFTPTEGAAVGAIAMLLVGLAQRSLDLAGHQRQPQADGRDLRA